MPADANYLTYAYGHAHAHTDSDPNPYSDGVPNGHGNALAVPHLYADANTYSYTDGDADRHSDAAPSEPLNKSRHGDHR